MNTALQTTNNDESLFSKNNLEHSLKVANIISKTEMTPTAYKNKPNDVLVAMELGRTWNLGPLQAIQNIAVSNGKPCAYGDLVLAICSSHKDFEDIKETPIYENNEIVGYTCVVKRKGRTETNKYFTKAQALKAGLWGKGGPWSQYPDRMLQMRARGFALRDSFADALNGVAIREEVEDYEIRDVTPKDKKSNSLFDKINEAKAKPEPEPEQEEKHEEKQEQEAKEETENKASIENLKKIHVLMNEKKFGGDRLASALKHYNVEYLGSLTDEQAKDFINHLDKL